MAAIAVSDASSQGQAWAYSQTKVELIRVKIYGIMLLISTSIFWALIKMSSPSPSSTSQNASKNKASLDILHP